MQRLNGETLIARKIIQLQQCPQIGRVVVGSEDDEILAEADRHGAEVVKRPEFYCDETQATANQVVENMCTLIRSDIILWAHCTNPLVSSQTYGRAIDAYLQKKDEGFDSLISVAELREHLWGADGRPMNYDPYTGSHVPAHFLPALFKQDGAIFIQPYNQMVKNHYFFGPHPFLFVMPEEEVLDINVPRDLVMARALLAEG